MISIIQNIFKVLCLAISLFLIGQLLYVFVEEKPTTTTKLEEELEITDLPEVVVCMDPGFNNSALTKYGYNINYYWKGISVVGRERFVGWKGLFAGNFGLLVGKFVGQVFVIEEAQVLRPSCALESRTPS